MLSPTKKDTQSGWVEQTWCTCIERVEEDVTESQRGNSPFPHSREKSSPTSLIMRWNSTLIMSFQKKTLMDWCNSRVRHYMDWTMNNPLYLTLIFLSYFLTSAAKFALKEECFDFGDNFDEAEEDDSPTKDSVSTRLPGAVPQPLFQF